MEVNCWTWMWSCMAQHHSTLNRAGASAPISPSPPPTPYNSQQRVVVGTCLWSAAIWLEVEVRNWNASTERLRKSSCPTLCPGLACIRITQSLHFAVNWDEMKGERHPWQLWTREPWLTSGQGWTVLCADASQPSHRILIKPFPHSMSSPWATKLKNGTSRRENQQDRH